MFFLIVYGLFLVSNLLLFAKLRRSLRVWFPAASPRRTDALLGPGSRGIERLPESLMRWYFYPGFVWYAMLIGYALVSGPKDLLWGAARALGWLYRRIAGPAAGPAFSGARRQFLAGFAPVLPSALLGTAAYGVYGTAGELEVSPEIPIPARNLPRELDGFRIAQLSDIHFGPYLRGRDLLPVVEAVNGIHAEMIVITGDILDRSLNLLPEAAESLSRLRAPYGIYAVLGNHDYYADQRHPPSGYRGCDRLIAGMEAAGVQVLRNQCASIRPGGGGAELLVAGLDWLGPTRGDPSVYEQRRTGQVLERMLAGANPDAVRLLLSHHPYSFLEAHRFDCPLTLAGHTHGGGQVVLGQVRGVPIRAVLTAESATSGFRFGSIACPR